MSAAGRDGVVAGALRRAPARVAMIGLLLLLWVAALAPLLANERPLAAGREGAWSFPAFAALVRDDFLWIAASVLAAALMIGRKARVVVAAIALGIAAFGTAVHVPRVEIGPVVRPGERAILAPVPFGPTNTDLARRFAGIGAPGHPLGTDELGRDVFARLLHGLRLSLLVGFAATAFATTLGIGLGAWAGCGGTISDAVASWIIQTSFCLPAVFVVAAAQSLGAISLGGVILVLALLRFGVVARLTRQETRRIRGQPFVLAAKGLGLAPWRVLLRHVLPNALIPATVAAAFGVAGAILAEAGLSFLGLGVPDPAPSLGRMLNQGRTAAPLAPHLIFLPGSLILLLVLSCHAIGAVLRDAIDPKGAEAAR